MTFVLPGNNKQYEIEFSTENLLEELFFEMEYGNADEMEELVSCSHSQELFPIKCERVFPGLPIPLNHPELMGGNIVIPETLKPKSSANSQINDDDDNNRTKSREGEDSQLSEDGEFKYSVSKIGRFGAEVEGAMDKKSLQKRRTGTDSYVMKVKIFHQEIPDSEGGPLVMPSIRNKGLLTSSSSSSHTSQRHHCQTTKPPTAMKRGTVPLDGTIDIPRKGIGNGIYNGKHPCFACPHTSVYPMLVLGLRDVYSNARHAHNFIIKNSDKMLQTIKNKKTLGRALDPHANGTWLSKLTE